MSKNEASSLLGAQPYKLLTKKTRRTFSSLSKDLEEFHRLGYVVSDEENIENVFAVGAPIRNSTGATIAALSGAVPRQKLTAKTMAELGKLVKESADRASLRLGAPKAGSR